MWLGACLRGTMLILKYFLVAGAVLTAGLIALNAHLLPAGSTVPAMAHSATSASLPTVFMAEIHERVHVLRQRAKLGEISAKDPIGVAASAIAQETRLLC